MYLLDAFLRMIRRDPPRGFIFVDSNNVIMWKNDPGLFSNNKQTVYFSKVNDRWRENKRGTYKDVRF